MSTLSLPLVVSWHRKYGLPCLCDGKCANTWLQSRYWDPNAGGMIVGLTQYSTASHIARATLEAVCYQSRAVLDVIEQESGVRLDELKVDGESGRRGDTYEYACSDQGFCIL